MADFTSQYTGSQVETAIRKALQLDDIEYYAQEAIQGKVYHVSWKVQPTESNVVYGFALHPDNGEWMVVKSVNGVKTIRSWREINTISNGEIDDLFDNYVI